jgi:hypothetical protein
MARLFRLEAAARRGARPVFLVLCGMAMMTAFPAERAVAQTQGAPIAGESGKAQSGGQTATGQQRSSTRAQDPQRVEEAPYPGGPGRRVEEAPYPGSSGGRVEEAPYPGGPGRRVEEAPRPGTLGTTEELQRLKGAPATAGSGTSGEQPAR